MAAAKVASMAVMAVVLLAAAVCLTWVCAARARLVCGKNLCIPCELPRWFTGCLVGPDPARKLERPDDETVKKFASCTGVRFSPQRSLSKQLKPSRFASYFCRTIVEIYTKMCV